MIVGIDLGTTNSLCAVFKDGQPVLVPNRHGNVLTPSVVGFTEADDLFVGEAAKELRVTKPERCSSRFKRLMGTKEMTLLNRNRLKAEELSSFVLRSLKEDAEEYLNEEVNEAVITVPAYFNDLQRRATKLAGELAGLTVRRIINEPTAAALAYGFHERDAEKHLLAVDLGGGTFDVTMMEVFEGTLEIIASAGESTLGGEDFTDRIMAHILEQHHLHLEVAEMNHPLLIARLREECEKAKRQLGKKERAQIRWPDDNGQLNDNSPQHDISVNEFRQLVSPLMDRIRNPIAKVLRDSKLNPADVEEVILVGGATRMPILKECIREMFGRDPLCKHDPDQVVAMGAAIQAALIINDKAVDDMVMTDVCPFTLGIEVVKEFAGREVNGFFMPIIHRNTTLPVSREDTVATIRANQREMKVNVYQGEHRKVEDNVPLGKLIVKDIPPGPAGTEVAVRFTYDLNGLLEVEAFVPSTGRKYRTVLTNHAQHLDEDEVQSAIKKLNKIKFYPRDDLKNQRLLLFSERVLGEISPDERGAFEQIIDSFENAMASGDRGFFQAVRDTLVQSLEQLGFPYDEVDRLDSDE